VSGASLPAWSEELTPGRLQPVGRTGLVTVDRTLAFGDGRGAGVKVAVVDSGVDAGHAAVRGLAGGVAVEVDDDAPGGLRLDEGPHEDRYGHGTACAGIIRTLAPDCELYSVRVLGASLRGRSSVFAAGLEWALEHGMQVVNLSLSTKNAATLPYFHDLVDRAVFAGVMLVCAVNNVRAPSYPSLFSGVFSVASTADRDPERFVANPAPPVDLGAPGIDVEVAWADGGRLVATGNSFAAPHVAGHLARLVATHPGITVAEAKAVLRALASNATGPPDR
jgi:subtilisin family serine protease